MRNAAFAAGALLLAFAMQAYSIEEKWDADNGKPAPPLTAAGWVGTPVSMEAIKGNTVVLAFWNADVAC
ncbi:MAG TPA: hypothetical protein VKX17_21185 [Planctomycetota bacterium]|nr:hypothetical protein [Planctomycetota bacterium]